MSDGGTMRRKYCRRFSVTWPVPVKTMSGDIYRCKTDGFWDIEDCPVPDGFDPVGVYKKVKSVLMDEGYSCEAMEIKVYGVNNEDIADKKCFDHFYAGIYYPIDVPRDKYARVNQLIRDILVWTLDNEEPSNLIIISKSITQDNKFPRLLRALESRHHCLLFVQPDVVSEELKNRYVRSVWLWKTLLDGGKPIWGSGSSQGLVIKLEEKKLLKSIGDTDYVDDMKSKSPEDTDSKE